MTAAAITLLYRKNSALVFLRHGSVLLYRFYAGFRIFFFFFIEYAKFRVRERTYTKSIYDF